MIFIYRPLEVEGHSDGSAARDRGVIGPDDVGLSRAKGARRLCGDHILRVFEANSEKYMTVPVSSADALRRVEWMDFQLKHARGENLQWQTNMLSRAVRKDIVVLLFKHKQKPTYDMN